MLSKSIKYEFKATSRLFLPLYAALIVMSIIACLVFSYAGSGRTPGQAIATMLTMTLTIGIFTAVWVVAIIVIIKRFWDNLLGREGYLTNVLPVSPWQHVFSKLLTSFVWVAASAIVSVIALLIMMSFVVSLGDLGQVASDMLHAYDLAKAEGVFGSAVLCTVFAVLTGIFYVAGVILHAYAAMSIGQLCSKHRIWACLGAYVGISIIMSVVPTMIFGSLLGINGLFTILFGSTDYSSFSAFMHFSARVLGCCAVYEIVVSGIMYALTSLLLQKKLNLQ